MNNLNSVLVEGNLVRDPLYRTTPKGRPVCTFSLASNRYRKHASGLEEDVSFFNIEAWAELAESCNNQGRKGRGVRVVGRLKQGRWKDGEGKSRSKVFIVAEHIEFRPDFRQDSAMEIHAKAISGQGTAEGADFEIESSERRYLEEEAYVEEQMTANAPASVVF